ncbi:MAG TPA: hypothetical protein VJX67_09500 [Blastocatellia bacterium]|nr:hypothetical protein [Blastocatellia bacterium]
MLRSLMILISIAGILVQTGCGGALGTARSDGVPVPRPSSEASSKSNPNPTPRFSPPPELKPSIAADPSFKSCNPYYPLVPGSQAKYAVKNISGDFVNEVTVIVDAISGGKGKPVFTETAQRVDPRKAEVETTTRKYMCQGERIEVISGVIDAKVGRTTARLESKFSPAATVMLDAASLTPGAEWSYSMAAEITTPGKPPVSRQAIWLNFEVKGSEDVTVPAGTFKTLHIAGKVKGRQIDEYYARGVGMVKRTSEDGSSWELTHYSGLTPLP